MNKLKKDAPQLSRSRIRRAVCRLQQGPPKQLKEWLTVLLVLMHLLQLLLHMF